MKSFSSLEIFKGFLRASQKWGMYISFDWRIDHEEGKISSDNWDELVKACPYFLELSTAEHCEGCAFLTFDSEEEMERYFYLTVGKDGATKDNRYQGDERVYALSIGPDGEPINENC